MRIEHLGELSPDDSIPEWLVSEKVDVPYFPGAKLRFVFDGLEDDDTPDEFASAVRRFLALTVRERDHAAPYVFARYREMCDAIGAEEVGVSIERPADVWNHVRPDE